MKKLPQGALSWAFYDWANSAFALTVMAGFFGPFYRTYWSNGAEEALSRQGYTVAAASLIIAVLAPVLGALADGGQARKRFLAVFVGIGCTATFGLYFVGEGQWQLASAVYIFAALGFFGANIFYDSLLLEVSDESNSHIVSGLGFALGYFGSVILFTANYAVLKNPDLLGLPDGTAAVKLAFLSVAMWWSFFTIPLLRNVREKVTAKTLGASRAIREGLAELKVICYEVIRRKPVLWFLIAYWFYIDGVNTLITMATGFGSSLGFEMGKLMVALILVQVVGVPFALLFGWLGQQFGARKLIFTGIVIYLGVTAYASRLTIEPVHLFGMEVSEIYVLGFLIGMVQGGLQSLSRSYFASLIPRERAAAYFGLYNMIGKSAALLGPLVMGFIAHATGKPRLGILAVAGLFLVGGCFLLLVRKADSAQA